MTNNEGVFISYITPKCIISVVPFQITIGYKNLFSLTKDVIKFSLKKKSSCVQAGFKNGPKDECNSLLTWFYILKRWSHTVLFFILRVILLSFTTYESRVWERHSLENSEFTFEFMNLETYYLLFFFILSLATEYF